MFDVWLSIRKELLSTCQRLHKEERSRCLQFLDFLGAKEPLDIVSFMYHLDCELFLRAVATMTSK